MDLSIFTTPEAWISLLTLTFLEIVLGVDNIVFISITTNRLDDGKRHIGRKLGLAGALVMRVLFLCFAITYLMDGMLERKRKGYKLAVYGFTGCAAGLYFIFYPELTGLSVPNWYATFFLRWFPSWPL